MSTIASVPLPVEALYKALEDKVRQLRPNEDLSVLERAFRFATEHHKEQK